MAFKVEVSKAAQKSFERLDSDLKKRIAQRLRELGEDPFEKSKQLRNWDPPTRSSRLGDWRILFTVDTATKAVVIASIEPRSGAY